MLVFTFQRTDPSHTVLLSQAPAGSRHCPGGPARRADGDATGTVDDKIVTTDDVFSGTVNTDDDTEALTYEFDKSFPEITKHAQAYEAEIKRATKLLEHVMSVLDANLISDINLIEADRRIRFTYNDIRYIVYHSGHVTIADTDRGVEVGGLFDGQAMKDLLGI